MVAAAGLLASGVIILRKKRVLDRAEKETDRLREPSGRAWNCRSLYATATERNRDIEGLEAIFEGGMREFNAIRQRRGMDARMPCWKAQRGMRRRLARTGPARAQPRVPRQRRFDQPLRGPVRHRVGHHDLVQGLATMGSHHRHRGPRHLGGAGRHRDGPVRGDPGGGPQPLRHRAERMAVRYDTFSEEFSSILQRQAHAED